MRGLEADLRHALRLYLKTPLASALAVLVLAVAMAFVSAFLSLWSDLALQRLAGFDGARGLVTVGQTDGSRFAWLSLNAIEAIIEESSTIASMAGVFAAPVSLADGEEGEPIDVEAVTRTYFSELQPRLQLGRALTEEDHAPSAAPVTVLSDRFWRQHFGGDPGVIGRTVRINGPPFVIVTPEGQARPAEQPEDYRVVGVMAPPVAGTFGTEVALWLPFEQAAAFWFGGAGAEAHRTLSQVRGLARPADGADPAIIRAELNERFAAAREPPLRLPSMRFDARSGVIRDFMTHEETLRQVRLFLAGSILLAFVAAATVSLFLLSRAPGRQRELAVRMAVGAPLRRLARQLVSEAALLVAAGTLVGVLVSMWLAVALREVPFLAGASWRAVSPLDFRVLGMIAGLMLLLTALVSVAPVMGLKRVGIGASSRAVTARAGVGQRLAGTVQLAVAGVLAGAALSFGWHLLHLLNTDHGFQRAGIVTVTLTPQSPGPLTMNPNPDALLVERERRRAGVSALPGVEAVAFGNAVPGRNFGMFTFARSPSALDDEGLLSASVAMDEAYFSVLGMRLRHGSTPEEADRNGVVVNETLARRLWGRSDVVGEVLEPGGATVVGVLRDTPYGHPADEPQPAMYRVSAVPFETMLVSGSVSVAELRAQLEEVIAGGELQVSVGSIEPLDVLWGRLLEPDRARTLLAAVAAALVVVLAGFGFYGMQRYLVMASQREYAIRAAVGAGPRALGRLVVRRGLWLALPGFALGLVLAFIAATWMREDFVAAVVSPAGVTLAVAAGMAALILAASVGPAWLARRTAPAPLLKEE